MKSIQQRGHVSWWQATKDIFKGIIDVKGVATRAGFWWGILDLVILQMINAGVFINIYRNTLVNGYLVAMDVCSFALLWLMAVLLLRRMHDAGMRIRGAVTLIALYNILLFVPVLSQFSTLVVLPIFYITITKTNRMTTVNKNVFVRFFLREKNTNVDMNAIKQSSYVSFKQAMKDLFKGYTSLSGRTTRSGYWWPSLITIPLAILFIGATILGMGCLLVFAQLATVWSYVANTAEGHKFMIVFGSSVLAMLVLGIIAFIFAIPMFASNIRRLRDVGFTNVGIVVYMVGLNVLSILFTMLMAVNNTICLYAGVILSIVLVIGQLIVTCLRSNALENRSFDTKGKFFRRTNVVD